MDARADRGIGKSDSLDARRIAAAVLPLEPEPLCRPTTDEGTRAALRTLLTACEHMTTEPTATVNALTALLRVADLGIDARKALTASQIGAVAHFCTRSEDLVTLTARAESVRLAQRVVALNEDLGVNHTQMAGLIRESKTAELLDRTGIGRVPVAVVYAAWSRAGRVRSEAAFTPRTILWPVPRHDAFGVGLGVGVTGPCQ